MRILIISHWSSSSYRLKSVRVAGKFQDHYLLGARAAVSTFTAAAALAVASILAVCIPAAFGSCVADTASLLSAGAFSTLSAVTLLSMLFERIFICVREDAWGMTYRLLSSEAREVTETR